MPQTLPEQLAAFRRDFEARGDVPVAIHETMHRATAELIASGAEARALKVGDKAPDFALRDAAGVEHALAVLLASGLLVVTFYRGVWCPYCNLDLKAMEAARAGIESLGARLVAISPQTAPNSRRSQRENELGFPILSDPGNAVAASFGLRFELPDYLRNLYENSFKNDLAVVNGDPSWTLPMPARFVIGQDGTIFYAEVSADYTNRPDPSELLPVLREARSSAL
ncbi:AhpC/TSA family protein [Sphingobium sp. AS12]|uniref:peroxiredoxin-like family protein n=1 Tax=Sphingobium sp. AS12 TaxID=2849495 RepID=UPI001C31BC76|nr:peroxiredoxin-like family protein [Sphingobium sp. AS12]MBV2150109.1 AhpC/TSA family protein [Sphingobium sp. AS12]